MKLLDCTLRDGGYYTNWDFSKETVKTYFEAFNHLPVEYLEVGYRSNPMKGYLGEYFYCPVPVLQQIKSLSNKKLVIILNEKDVRAEDAEPLLKPIAGLVDMVRIAIDPKSLERAVGLAKEVKKLGFEVGFNVMYMSTWASQKAFLDKLPLAAGAADIFYMVDSFGGVYPQDVRDTIALVRSKVDIPLGFHGHNNMELGLINTLVAIEEGCAMVDATITGMGRGAGNLKTELLLTVLNAQGKLDFDFNALSRVVDVFTDLQKHYEWGTNLPYMVSGANSLPQKNVMEWVSKRYYSFNSIIRALDNESKGVDDNERLPVMEFSAVKKYSAALIVGGGPSAVEHTEAIDAFLMKHPDMVVIHASSRNAMCFTDIPNDQYFCLVGNEGYRLESVFGDASKAKGQCILPPFPRKMGTYIPSKLKDRAFELKEVTFTDKLKDTHTSLAIETARAFGITRVYLVGYDGYSNTAMGTKEQELYAENEFLFGKAKSSGLELISLTATTYTHLVPDSVFARIS
ncbi:4-hydroxy 2-oxovalerate aldolase [Cyclonatronum proteinivorum]|uniref:4-hydroxy 2-oxovalerate aldolase n=1 Tax=Cyclonatronum proteinivorum TaxID=1457365 RepID=A0A345UMJ6_9BACT|nr:aldolase catalytic domain-containing protein [Cyclonatronum proteinivorum]AXJ01698.1 4-hydroxy 2-oxovalerate aldolase [Cyclonatronum proteinivorum]